MALPIQFDILWWNDSQSQLSELGVRPEVKEAETRTVMFYMIDNVAPYFEDGSEMTTIRSGGSEYITPLVYSEVVALLAH